VSMINGKPAVEWTFDREIVLSPNLGPDQSDFYWQINAPCLPWPTCAYEPTPISFDPPTAGEPTHTDQTPPYVPPHTPDVPVPMPGTATEIAARRSYPVESVNPGYCKTVSAACNDR